MEQSLVFWPMVAHALLVVFIYLELGRCRFIAVKTRKASYNDFKIIKPDNEPDLSAKAARNLTNNFEAPVLFHAVIVVLYAIGAITWPVIYLAWCFVISRYIHSLVHLTQNHVYHRTAWFILGIFILVVLWVMLALALIVR